MTRENWEQLPLQLELTDPVPVTWVSFIQKVDGQLTFLVAPRKNDPNPNRKSFPGGKIAGESPSEAASRETYEETGLQIDPEVSFISTQPKPIFFCQNGNTYEAYPQFAFWDESTSFPEPHNTEPEKLGSWGRLTYHQLVIEVVQGNLPPAILGPWIEIAIESFFLEEQCNRPEEASPSWILDDCLEILTDIEFQKYKKQLLR